MQPLMCGGLYLFNEYLIINRMNKFRRHPYPSILASCLLALGLFLILTNPDQVSVGVLVVPVLLLFFIVFSLSHIIMEKLKLLRRNLRKRRIVAIITASLATVVMILRSTGGLSVPDIILLCLIIVVSAVYIDKY